MTNAPEQKRKPVTLDLLKESFDMLGIDPAAPSSHPRTVISLWETIPLTEPQPIKFHYMFHMEVYKPHEPLWLLIWTHQIRQDLIADLRLYEQQWRLINVLQQIGEQKSEMAKMQACL
jgi:hypothetical protein